VGGCAYSDENVSLLKAFPVFGDRVSVRFDTDFFNIFNRKHFVIPRPTLATRTSAGFRGPDRPRIAQLTLKSLGDGSNDFFLWLSYDLLGRQSPDANENSRTDLMMAAFCCAASAADNELTSAQSKEAGFCFSMERL
jgi:hypothetical protein